MKNKILFTTFLLPVLIGLATMAGCSKTNVGPVGINPAKVPGVVTAAFNKSSENAKQDAQDYVAAFQSQDAAVAFAKVRALSTRPDLTPEQRTVVAGAMQTTFQRLENAAQNGNSAAKGAMHQYFTTR